MHDRVVSKKLLFIILGYVMVFFVVLMILDFKDNRTIVVFCDVGRGDATYIRVRNKTDILIDAGGSSLVTSCLGKHMPYYDRTIEFAIITRASKNQYEGYRHILNRYSIANLIVSTKDIKSAGYQKLLTQADKSGARITLPPKKQIVIEDASLSFLWLQEYTNGHISARTQPSLTVGYKQNSTSVLILGKSSPSELTGLFRQVDPDSTVVKISEYGFEEGTFLKLLSLADPSPLLINRQTFKADLIQTYSLAQQERIKTIAGSGDIEYRF